MYQLVLDAINNNIKPLARFAYIMGSVGTSRFHSKSDIDIAVYFNPPLDTRSHLDLGYQLEDILHREVQIVPLNDIDPIFARQVLETGRLAFCQDPGLLLDWKAQHMSKYLDFKRSREVIEKSLMNRKKYG